MVDHVTRSLHALSIRIRKLDAEFLFEGHDQFYAIQSNISSQPSAGISGNWNFGPFKCVNFSFGNPTFPVLR
ncbi:MAG: hypothetical protein K0Q55_560 [Verrucomicrobia bacterium]|jgi:hypothetical protein|nr:hypothetical protein [Verrucomicrobiota bacterium]